MERVTIASVIVKDTHYGTHNSLTILFLGALNEVAAENIPKNEKI